MLAWFESFANFAPQGAGLLADFTLKASLILALAWLLTSRIRHASAAARHVVWLAALTASLCLPLAGLAPPAWPLPILPVSAPKHAEMAHQRPEAAADAANNTMSSPQLAATDSPAPISPRTAAEPSPQMTWQAAVLLTWAFGAAALLVRFVLARLAVRQTERRATPLTGGPLVAILTQICVRLALRRPPAVLIADEAAMPMTWGIRKPRVLLPAAAARWTAERCRLVLLHELAHVKRRDSLSQLVAQLAQVLGWFNPLVWLAIAKLRLEAEQACDDWVLVASGVRPSEYARQLFDISRCAHTPMPFQPAAIAVARRSSLEHRVRAILKSMPSRRPATPAFVGTCSVGFLTVATILGVLRWSPHELNAAETPSSQTEEKKTARSAESLSLDELDAVARLALSIRPVVVHTVPAAGSTDVDPNLTEIKATFSTEMQDGSWSWTQNEDWLFPATTGKPYYAPGQRTCTLPVKLEPGRTYWLMLNSSKFHNFKDSAGRSAMPYLLVFQTRPTAP